MSPILRAAATDTGTIVDRGRSMADRFIDELSAVTSHIGELEEMIEAETAGDKNPKRREAMYRAIELPMRSQVLKNIATAVRTFAEAAPGKKEEAQRAADTAGEGTDWGDDLDATTAGRPN